MEYTHWRCINHAVWHVSLVTTAAAASKDLQPVKTHVNTSTTDNTNQHFCHTEVHYGTLQS